MVGKFVSFYPRFFPWGREAQEGVAKIVSDFEPPLQIFPQLVNFSFCSLGVFHDFSLNYLFWWGSAAAAEELDTQNSGRNLVAFYAEKFMSKCNLR